jgi:CheY-like chemotaxis protein
LRLLTRQAVATSERMPKAELTPNVLVIDDCEIARAEMLHRLRRAGLAVSHLASPIGATRVIVDQAIDVVVIDVQMPSIRGDRLAALFKGNPRFATLGVILVTGGSEEELEELGSTAKADAVLSKSELDQLVDLVKEIFRRHAGSHSGAHRSERPQVR